MELNLKGKVALVTGATHGLGKSICESLAAEGVHIVVNYYRNAEKAVDFGEKGEEVADALRGEYGIEALPVPGDVSSEADVIEMFRLAEEKFPDGVDILVNNAGICPTAFIKDMPEEMWSATIATNLTGTFLTCREMVRRLLASDRKGRVVNVASQAAFNGSATGKAHYASSKGGMVAFTVSLAREMASQGTTVNCVAPGMMYTEMVAETLEKNAERYAKQIPLGRIAETSEIADVITFLASDRGSYITGATVDVSGGMLMR